MTGFDRPNRSFYLDDLEVFPGDFVVCRSSMFNSFTVGCLYKVLEDKMLMNDSGEIVYPSCRFTPQKENSNALN